MIEHNARPVLEVKDLSITFCSEGEILPAVDDISFSVRAGECLGIAGESGSGKSVTAMSLARLLPQPSGRISCGEIYFQGRNVLRMTDRELQELRGAGISYIFQEPLNALNPVHSIGKQIIEALRLHRRISRSSAAEIALQLLRQVRIPAAENCMSSYPHELSGGMRQRVIIAMALACQPRLIIADEATTALDVTVQQQILSLLKEAQVSSNASCLLISHDLGIIAQSCDRVLIMYAGRIVESAPVAELFARPLHAYTRALLACLPQRNAVAKTLLPAIPGQVAGLSEMVYGCRFCQRMGVPIHLLEEKPPMCEVYPDHWVEYCPNCVGDF